MGEPARYDIIASPEDQTVVLAGPPGQLTGRVDFHNRGDADVVLRDAGLKDPSGVLTTRTLRLSLSTLVLRANQEKRVQLTFAVDPATPQGEYHAELELGGRSLPVLLHILEALDLTVQPHSIVVLNRPGEPQRKRIVVTNQGNVTFSVGDVGEVDLEDDTIPDDAGRLRLEPLTEIGKKEIEAHGHKGPVLVLLRIGRPGAFREAGLSVRKLGDKVNIAPGETVPIDLDITLREKLPPNSRYRGTASILTRDLEIVVVSSGDLHESPRPKSGVKRNEREEHPKGHGGKR